MSGIPYVLKNPNFKYIEKFQNMCNLNTTYKCPHDNCNVIWNSEKQLFICQCNGCKFDLNGTVVKGPATDNLNC